MNFEQALDIIEWRECCTECVVPEGKCEECDEAFKMTFVALQKQIPKPKHKYQGIRCVCGTEVAKYQKYCDECGQRLLDWEEK